MRILNLKISIQVFNFKKIEIEIMQINEYSKTADLQGRIREANADVILAKSRILRERNIKFCQLFTNLIHKNKHKFTKNDFKIEKIFFECLCFVFVDTSPSCMEPERTTSALASPRCKCLQCRTAIECAQPRNVGAHLFCLR